MYTLHQSEDLPFLVMPVVNFDDLSELSGKKKPATNLEGSRLSRVDPSLETRRHNSQVCLSQKLGFAATESDL